MTKMRLRKSWVALLAILLLFAACKGETPTAPPPGGDTPGGTTPPLNATLTLVASKTNPLINETVTLTATVTIDGQPAPNGTAVEFRSNNAAATFTDSTTPQTIRITTNGVATATLTSATTGTTRVTATVNNVSRFVDITFGTPPVTPCVPPDPACTPSNDPVITSVEPSIGRPSGGEQIRIIGKNFRGPARVLFDLGNGQIKEAFVVSVSETEIVAITPAVDLGAGQQATAQIIVLTEAGSPDSDRIVAPSPFTFRNAALTPVVYTITPNSGPQNGGTLVTVVGEGFQSPMQVLFGSAEARITSAITFSQFIVETPPATATNPTGSGTTLGPVAVTVRNVGSNTSGTSPLPFNYHTKMQITGATPISGSALGGTDITISGLGFDSKTQVFIGGVEARVLSVSGSQLLVRTNPIPIPCATLSSQIHVTNVENGDSDIWGNAPNEPGFTYFPIDPIIIQVTSATGEIRPGTTVDVLVDDPGVGPLGFANILFGVAGRFFIPAPRQITNATAPQSFEFALPLTGFTFPTETCTTDVFDLEGTRSGPTETTIQFLNETTGCTDSIIVPLLPPLPNTCLTPPRASVTQPPGGTCATPTAPIGGSDTQQIVISNGPEARPLNVTNVALSGANASQFTITPTSASNIAAGGSFPFNLTFNPTGTAGGRTATVTFTTNSPGAQTLTVCVNAVAAAPPP